MPAVTVSMLGAIESLMSATVADRMSGDRHNPNVELADQPAALITRADFRCHVGDANICRSVQEALRRAAEIHAEHTRRG